MHTITIAVAYYHVFTVSQLEPSHTITTGVNDPVVIPQSAHHVVGIKNGYL